jgi:hypothetical protein
MKRKCQTGTDDVYVPTLWYYELMEFVLTRRHHEVPFQIFQMMTPLQENIKVSMPMTKAARLKAITR